MALAAAYDGIDPAKVMRFQEGGPERPASTVFPFFWPAPDAPHDPHAFLVRYGMGTQSSAHYHGADQFQIVVEGKGKLGHHELGTVSVHFARGYTPYGPLIPDKQEGWAFLTLRVRHNPVGTQRLPGAADKLKAMPDRRPFQASVPGVSFEGEGIKDVPTIRNEEGLFVSTIKLQPNASATAPDPSKGDGQYIVVTRGSLLHDGKEYRGLATVFVRETESAYTV